MGVVRPVACASGRFGQPKVVFEKEIAMSRRLLDLIGRVALVTGGSEGLGIA